MSRQADIIVDCIRTHQEHSKINTPDTTWNKLHMKTTKTVRLCLLEKKLHPNPPLRENEKMSGGMERAAISKREENTFEGNLARDFILFLMPHPKVWYCPSRPSRPEAALFWRPSSAFAGFFNLPQCLLQSWPLLSEAVLGGSPGMHCSIVCLQGEGKNSMNHEEQGHQPI